MKKKDVIIFANKTKDFKKFKHFCQEKGFYHFFLVLVFFILPASSHQAGKNVRLVEEQNHDAQLADRGFNITYIMFHLVR
jgi:hypothetical protein